MDTYETFRRMLDAHPAGAPPSRAIDEILRILFTGEEIRIAIHMSYALKTADEIARAASVEHDEAQLRLEAMATGGVIFSRRTARGTRYALMPVAPGLCERSLRKSLGTPLHGRLQSLWKRYRDDGFIASMLGDPTSLMRVIPVESAVPLMSNILPHASVSNLIRSSGTIVVEDCSCRAVEQHCASPMETCFSFGPMADFLVDKSLGRRVSPDEALTILDETEKAGLIHCANNSADKADKICNCCPCCCIYLKGLLEFGNPHAVAASPYCASADTGACTACGICTNGRCRVEAIVPWEGTVRVLTEKCIGCGLCVSACPAGALMLRERDDPPETPATAKDLAVKTLSEKGKLEAFMDIVTK